MSKKGIFFFSPLTTMHCGLPNVVIYKEIANARRHFLPRNANYIRESGEKFIHIRVPTCVISSLQICMNTLKSILIPRFLEILNFDKLQIRSISSIFLISHYLFWFVPLLFIYCFEGIKKRHTKWVPISFQTNKYHFKWLVCHLN